MKKVFFWVGLVAIVFTRTGFCQESVPSFRDYQDFLKSKTLVVLENNVMSDFNRGIKKAMERSWTITPFEFISSRELKNYARESHYSFLMMTLASFDKDRTKANYYFLSLLRGGKSSAVDRMPDLCSIPLSYQKVEDDGYSYKLEAFLRFVQNHVQLILKEPSLIGKNSLKYYNKNRADLKGKTLYLTKEDLAHEIDSSAKIRKVYSHPFEIVTREKVAQAIAEKKKDIVFLHKVGPENTRIKARVYKILMGAADSRLYYFDYDMVKKPADDALQEKDLKRIR